MEIHKTKRKKEKSEVMSLETGGEFMETINADRSCMGIEHISGDLNTLLDLYIITVI